MSTPIADAVRAFIVESFLFGDASQLGSNELSLLDQGVIDSTGVLELVAFLEESFGVHVEDSELLPDNLDSIDRIVAFVSRKQG